MTSVRIKYQPMAEFFKTHHNHQEILSYLQVSNNDVHYLTKFTFFVKRNRMHDSIESFFFAGNASWVKVWQWSHSVVQHYDGRHKRWQNCWQNAKSMCYNLAGINFWFCKCLVPVFIEVFYIRLRLCEDDFFRLMRTILIMPLWLIWISLEAMELWLGVTTLQASSQMSHPVRRLALFWKIFSGSRMSQLPTSYSVIQSSQLSLISGIFTDLKLQRQ